MVPEVKDRVRAIDAMLDANLRGQGEFAVNPVDLRVVVDGYLELERQLRMARIANEHLLERKKTLKEALNDVLR